MVENAVFDVMQSFRGSFLNQYGELVVHEKANQFFNIRNCKDDLEIKCKVLEWLSRGAFKTEPFGTRKKNDEFNAFMLDGINKFLKTQFTKDEMRIIYQELGNGVNRTLCIRFIESGFELNLLRIISQQPTSE